MKSIKNEEKPNTKSKAPAILQQWLDRINDVPVRFDNPEDRLIKWENLVSNAFFKLTGRGINSLIEPLPAYDYGDWQPPSHEDQQLIEQARELALDDLREKTERFPLLHSYLFRPLKSSPFGDLFNEERSPSGEYLYGKSADERYEKFLQMQKDIREIARTMMTRRNDNSFVSREAVLKKLGWKGKAEGYRTDLVISNGMIGFESELTQIFKNVPAERLRICPICHDVFWAKRIETSVCSKKKCSNAFHQRKRAIAEYQKTLEIESEKYQKMQSNLEPENISISSQRKKVNKLTAKINEEKYKNGNL